jgi:hypothetical protein
MEGDRRVAANCIVSQPTPEQKKVSSWAEDALRVLSEKTGWDELSPWPQQQMQGVHDRIPDL